MRGSPSDGPARSIGSSANRQGRPRATLMSYYIRFTKELYVEECTTDEEILLFNEWRERMEIWDELIEQLDEQLKLEQEENHRIRAALNLPPRTPSTPSRG